MGIRRRGKCVILFAGFLLTAQAPCFAASQNYLQMGIEKYNTGDYPSALFEFWHAQSDSPRNPLVEYYIASALARMGKSQDAIYHFQKAYQWAEKNSNVYQMASAALAAYGRSGQTILSSAHSGLTATATTGMPAQLAHFHPVGQGGGSAAPVVEPIPGMSDAQRITIQDPMAARRAQREAQRAQRAAQRAQQLAARQQRLSERSRQRSSRSGRSYYPADRRSVYSNNTPYSNNSPDVDSQIRDRRYDSEQEIQRLVARNRPYSNAQITAIKQQCEDDCQRMRAEDDARKGAAERQKSQANLDDQLRDQKLTDSGIRLQSQGTNLNIRNYELYGHSDGHTDDSLIPLIAVPQKLSALEPALRNMNQSNTGTINVKKIRPVLIPVRPGLDPVPGLHAPQFDVKH